MDTLKSSTNRIITEDKIMNMHNPPHAGEVLKDYIEGVSITAASESLGVTRAALSRILNGHAGITADMALRLADALGTSAELWVNLQTQYDLAIARQKIRPTIKPIGQHAVV
jgi:addiction module HigA family antidote